MVGPIHPIGLNGEKYFITFTDLGSRYSIRLTIMSRAHVNHAMTAELLYSDNIRGEVPRIIHSDNEKEYQSIATVRLRKASELEPKPLQPITLNKTGWLKVSTAPL